MANTFRGITLKKNHPGLAVQQIPARFQQALTLHQQGDLRQAIELYRAILQVDPQHFDSLHLLGVAALQTGHTDQGIHYIRQAIALNPRVPAAYNNLGNALKDRQQSHEALACYERALALDPGYAEAHNNRGNLLRQQGQADQAIGSYDQALAIRPDYAEALNNKGNALGDLERQEQALRCYDQALVLRPDYAEAHNNRGVTLRDLGQLDQALASYERALALRPDYADARRNKALALLLAGHFSAGWPWYESRIRPEAGKRFDQPQWDGQQPLTGKTILVHSEQGLGDTIQFCRYAKLLAARGARVVLEVQQPLTSLLRELEGVTEVCTRGETLPGFDLHSPLLSLPMRFGTTLDNIPAPPAYLHSDSDKAGYWARQLGPKSRLRVGLVWSGGTEYRYDHTRSLPLSSLLPFLPAGHDYVSLQKELHERDRPLLMAQDKIRHFGEELQDFSDTAALCEQMDLIISTDTSVAHLAGALGKKTWLLLSHVPDWRWLQQGSNCIWYPGMTLYRQAARGDWPGVLSRLEADLKTQDGENQQP
jgi:tetratricopeptide (TPR) repeat protein